MTNRSRLFQSAARRDHRQSGDDSSDAQKEPDLARREHRKHGSINIEFMSPVYPDGERLTGEK